MRSLLLITSLLLAGCSQAPLGQASTSVSAGCENLNDPFYDDAYFSGNVYFSPFSEGESVTVSFENLDAAADIYLIVTNTSGETHEDLATQRATSR